MRGVTVKAARPETWRTPPNLCQTVSCHGTQFVRLFVLKHLANVPSVACCLKCKREFFTPAGLLYEGAEEYLLEQFARHDCAKEPEK